MKINGKLTWVKLYSNKSHKKTYDNPKITSRSDGKWNYAEGKTDAAKRANNIRIKASIKKSKKIIKKFQSKT